MGIRRVGLVAAVSITAMVAATLPAKADSANTGATQIAGLLGVPANGQPTSGGPDQLSGQTAADPGAQVSLIDPPAANSQGAARLSYPIDVPPGRAGTQPNLSIDYDSGNADGWLGLGWDLSTPAIAVDTRWGVPRYLKTKESESYDLNGSELAPLAHTGTLAPRAADRTFHLRVEGSFDTITRVGDSPANYYWKVVDQGGNVFLYGARERYVGDSLVTSLDPGQVLRGPDGNIAKWPLLEEHDFNGNVTSYHYQAVDDPAVAGGTLTGTQLYLTSITYDGTDTGTQMLPPPYEVDFGLTKTLSNGDQRPDALSDARFGFLTVSARLLHTITVSYQGRPIRSYDLAYRRGEFDKTLLTSITQNGSDGTPFTTHRFTYYDNVHGLDGSYDGFAPKDTWHTGSDDISSAGIVGLEKPSALSGAYANSYDGHIYLGFNPLDSSKDSSVGVSVDYNHVDSADNLAMIDINGDGLPDKVFEASGGVWYRLNHSGPDGGTTFGSPVQIAGLDTLGQESSDSVGVGPEGYLPVGNVMYHHSWTFTTSPIYFIDVNNDGLPDLVHHGHVLFDHLDGAGTPAFDSDSSTTRVPIGSSKVDPGALLPGLTKIYQQELAASPLQDAVRRWIAPYTGTVSITGDVHLVKDTSAARKAYTTADGVTVAIQHNGAQLWSTKIGPNDYAAKTPTGVDTIAVHAGDRLYFRVESGFDGRYDQVFWDPVITYAALAHTNDANTLDTASFDAADDFTTAGRQAISVTMPFDGTVAMTGDLTKARATSDDIAVQVVDAGTAQHPTAGTVLYRKALGWNQTGTITGPSTLHVHKGEMLRLQVQVDSRIDLRAINWDPHLYYTEATNEHGGPVDVKDKAGNYDISLSAPYSIDIYPRSTIAAPDTGHSAAGSRNVVPTSALTAGSDASGRIAFTAKATDALLAKEILTITKGAVTGCQVEDVHTQALTGCALPTQTIPSVITWPALGVTMPAPGRVYYDFSVLDHQLSDDVTAGAVDGVAAPVHGTYDPTKTIDKGLFAQPYRGWAVAAYNGGDRSDGKPMDESKLMLDLDDYPTPSNYYHPDLAPDSEGYPTKPLPADGFAGAADANGHDPLHAGSWPLSPMPAHEDRLTDPPAQVPAEWMGAKSQMYVRASAMSSTRMGQDYILEPTPGAFAGAGAVSQMSQTQQDALAGGVVNVGGSYSWGPSNGVLDELDMNGDGFPDIVGQDSIQYTNTVGSLDDASTSLDLDGHVRQSNSMAWSIGASGNPAKISANAKGDSNAPQQAQSDSGTVKKANSAESGAADSDSEPAGQHAARANRPGSAGSTSGDGESESAGAASSSSHSTSASRRSSSAAGGEPDADPPESESDGGAHLHLGVGGQYAKGSTNHHDDHAIDSDLVNTDLVDVNGDGLPDRVSTYTDNTMKVAFNLGYGFSRQVAWSGNAVSQSGSSTSISVNGDIGFNDGIFGLGGGVTGGVETDQDDEVLVDVNGDGLADDVTEHGGDLYVSINTGTGFAPVRAWHGAVASDIATSTSDSLGGGAYFTIGIGPLCIEACYIIVNPGFDYNRTVSRQELELRDINGDGYPDDLASTGDSSVDVALNNTGKTNLLRNVDRPLGASFTIDYTRTGNTTAHPASTWAMSKVTVDDNTPAASANQQLTTYDYSGNVYNPNERETYGFGTVTENQLDPATGTLYRRIVSTYANDNYYDQGLLTDERVEDGAGHLYTDTSNDYTLRDVDTGKTVDPGHAATDAQGSVFPELTKTSQRYYEGQPAAGKSTSTTYRYDSHGNPTLINDNGDGTADAVIATIAYTNCPDSNVFNVPISVVLRDAAGAVLRKQTADVPCSLGAPTKIDQYLADGTPIETEIKYLGQPDHYNIDWVKSPPNADGRRYTVHYTYDADTGTYVASTTDSFGYTSSATYNPMFASIASSTDINGNTTNYQYDAFGRLSAIVGPEQQGTGTTTLAFSYDACGAVAKPCTGLPWAQTRAIDTLHGGTLDSVTIADGLDRTVQTKHDATVFTSPTTAPADVMVVSGRVVFDFLGRTVKQYYPTTEPVGTPTVFNPGYDSQKPSVSGYDTVDRLVSSISPSGLRTTWAYGFGPDRSGTTEFENTKTDALGYPTSTFSNIRHQVTAIEKVHDGKKLWTSYQSSPLNLLTTITDDAGHVTKIGYDNVGRRTSIDTPDTGLTTMTYDPASHLIGEQTANERAHGSGQTEYIYDYTHLQQINYPSTPEIDVRYSYGAPAAPDNGAGRVVGIDDQAGSQAYTYDAIGEVTSEADTIDPIHGQPLATYTTKYQHDTWGRLGRITYPDGEVLHYSYDAGGLVDGATGVRAGEAYQYVQALQYDKFGHIVFQRDGNGVTSSYGYLPTSQLLHTITSGTANDQFQNESYGYDRVGNVTSATNDVATPGGGQYGGPSSQTYTYDDLYRLIGATGSYHYAPNDTRTYALALGYDSIGDIVTNTQTDTITRPGGASQVQAPTTHDWVYAYGHSQPNAVTDISGSGTLAGNSHGKGSGHSPAHAGVQLTYDADGNQTGWHDLGSGQRRTIVWDDANRMQSLANNGQTTRYRYDADGNRVVTVGPGGVTTTVNRYYTVVNGANTVDNIYVGGQRVAQHGTGGATDGLYYYHHDLTGSTGYVTDASGQLFEHLAYLPTGQTWVDEVSNPHVIAYRYTSHPFDSVTDLSYLGARSYAPRLNQMVSADPAVQADPALAITDPMLLNPYSYVDNSPVRYVDPTGAAPVDAQASFIRRSVTAPTPTEALQEGVDQTLHAAPAEQSAARPAPTSSKGRAVKAFKAIATFEVPPLIEFEFSGTKLHKVKIIGISTSKLRSRP